MNNIIITGAGKGLGKALSEVLSNKTTRIFLIGRDEENLNKVYSDIVASGGEAKVIKCDLGDTDKIDCLVKNIINSIKVNERQMITLINNAGTIEPIECIGNLKNEDIERNLRLNCISPTTLINSFISKTKDWNTDVRIINISSGVVKKTLEGWSLYSASKSAVHSFINTIHCEQENKKNPVKVVSFDPGVMNTDMQKYIREVPKYKFNKVDLFKSFHDNGTLRETKDIASKIKEIYIDDWLAKETFETIWKYESSDEENI